MKTNEPTQNWEQEFDKTDIAVSAATGERAKVFAETMRAKLKEAVEKSLEKEARNAREGSGGTGP